MEFRLTESVKQKSVMPEEETYLATLMNTSQVAGKLGVSGKQVRRLIASGKIAGVRVSGRPYVRRIDFEEYMQRMRIKLEDQALKLGVVL